MRQILKLIMLCMIIIFARCKNENADTENSVQSEGPIIENSEELLNITDKSEFEGKWICTKVDPTELLNSEAGDSIPPEKIKSLEEKMIGNSYLLLNKDGTCDALVVDDEITGTWDFDISSSTLTLTRTAGELKTVPKEFKVLSKDDVKMIINGGNRNLGFEFELE